MRLAPVGFPLYTKTTVKFNGMPPAPEINISVIQRFLLLAMTTLPHLDRPQVKPAARPGAHKRRSWLVRCLKILGVVGTLLFGLLSVEIISSGTSPTEVFRQLGRLITSRDRMLDGEAEGQINLLVLGIGGAGHEGPLLTDSMLLVSLKPAIPAAAVISIPRDLLVAVPGFGPRRINTAYALTEVSQRGQGIPAVKALMAEIFGLPVHYTAVVDFAGFRQLVDAVGGVTIDVEHPLDDEFYPRPGQETATSSERFEHLIIPAGRHRFDGELALKYVRSRKSKGIQGSDFARGHRQQQVMSALMDQIGSWGLLKPGRVSEVLRTLSGFVETDLEPWELARLYQLARAVPAPSIVRHVLDDRPNGLLVAKNFEGAYVLIPRTGDFAELHRLGENPFAPIAATQGLGASQGLTAVAPNGSLPPPPSPPPPPVRLQIHNGTTVAGLAGATEQFLRERGFTVVAVGNAPIQTYLRTVVYNLRPPAHARELQTISELLQALTFESGPPAPLVRDGVELPYPVNPDADVLIILGKDAAERIPENF